MKTTASMYAFNCCGGWLFWRRGEGKIFDFLRSKPLEMDFPKFIWIESCDKDNIYFEDPSLGAGEVGFIPRAEFADRWHDVDHNCEPLYQYGLALSYPEHPFYDSPMNRIRKID